MNNIFEFKSVSYTSKLKGNFEKKVLTGLNGTILLPENSGVVSIFSDSEPGKEELMQLLSGLIKPTEGGMSNIFGKTILPFVPSSPSTLPWLNVIENVSIASKLAGGGDSASVEKAIEMTELDGYETHFPAEKSHGFLFRVALARALSIMPPCVVIDDPYVACSKEVQDEITGLLRKVASELKIYIIVSTSNYAQGVAVGDVYYWFTNKEITKLTQVVGADNILSMIY